MAVVVRPRVDADLDACVDLAGVVRALDGYPPYLPGGLREFLATPGALGAWVAEVDGALVGHVALHPDSSAPVMALAAEATGLPAARLAVVARLLVAPDARRQGLGSRLLGTAAAAARGQDRCPILDVVERFTPAHALYERAGWRRVGTVVVALADGTSIDEAVYVGPGPSA